MSQLSGGDHERCSPGDWAKSGTLRRDMLEGLAVELILAVADARGIDIIIMGTRGLGRLAGLLVGSQSQKIDFLN